MLRFGPSLARVGLLAGKLTAPFAKVVDRCVTDPWLRRFMDLECFVLRRVPAQLSHARLARFCGRLASGRGYVRSGCVADAVAG